NSSELCENDTLLLSTQSYSGSNIAYNWYSGSCPNGLLLASTSVPLYKNPPPLQSQTYYVVVEIDGCSSDASALASTTVSDVPSSSVLDAVVDICEGASFALGTNSSGAGFTYQWTGPNGFQSSSQFPSLISEAMLADSGQYRVVISNNGCSSDPAVTMVNIRPRPPQPVLFTEGVLCNGDTLELSTNIPDGGFYTWTGPDGTNYLTTESQLSVLNASANSTGNWQVVVNRDGCNSAPSDSVNVFVEQPPLVIATNNGPVCEGDSVRLVANEIPGATYLWNGPAGFSSLGRRVDVPAVQGNYSIRVSSSLGCVSTVATNVQIYNAPQITAISTSGTDCFFQGDTIRLVPTIFPADDGDYNYLWTSDNGFRALDAQPLIRLDSTSNNRQYSLVVTDNNGCISEQDIIQLALQQAPPTPPIDGPEVICSGDVLTLNSRPYAGRDVLYLWQTPLGTDTTSIPSLTISPVDAINSGNYRLQVVVDGCSSPFSSTIPLQVSTSLPAPIAIASGPICEGDTIRLTTDEISGASYEWTGPDGFSFSGPSPVIVNASAANVGSYSVRIDVDGCSSPFSVPVFVDVQSLPTAPILEGVDPVCIDVDNSSVRLSFVNGTAVQGASYIWYDAQTGGQIGGPTFSTSFLLSDFSNYGEGTFDFYVIAELAGCASLPSVPVSVEMNAFPNEEAEAGDDQNFCDVNSTTLNAQSPSVGDGRWRQIQGPAADIVAPDQAVTAVNDLLTNVPYVFEWSLSNGVCLDYSSDQLEVFIGQNEAVAFAGEDVVDCGDGAIQLQADRPASGSGRWTTPDLNLNIIDPSDPGTTVQGLENGSYLFVWTVENGICGSTSDSVEVDYELLPLAFDDDFELDFAPDVFVNVLDDDEVSAPFDIKLGQMPANGAVENLEDGRFRYEPGEGFVQTDEFSYLICSKRCPDQCSEGVVRIRLIRDLACEAPTIFTPNNDRVNDAFVVPCLDSGQYPDSQLSVFNQWGDEVHRAAPYQNDWEGTHQGNPLPVGTYYYILEFGNGEPAVSGFLVLER
ncbi:MAG: gliding motility-associated C-terminal domain-containing protein, partial [Bacteroidota bacterium]